MNVWVFIVVTYVMLALQRGFGYALSLGEVRPNLLLILAVFIGLCASRPIVLWSCFVLGLLLDLQPGPFGGDGAILGPRTLGMLVGGYAIVQLRNMVFRESVLTLMVMTLVAGVFLSLVEVMIYTARALPLLGGAPQGWGAMDRLGERLLETLYSAAVAVPLGLLLNQSRSLWGFSGRSRSERAS